MCVSVEEEEINEKTLTVDNAGGWRSLLQGTHILNALLFVSFSAAGAILRLHLMARKDLLSVRRFQLSFHY